MFGCARRQTHETEFEVSSEGENGDAVVEVSFHLHHPKSQKQLYYFLAIWRSTFVAIWSRNAYILFHLQKVGPLTTFYVGR